MSDIFFEAEAAATARDDERLIVDVDGFEGSLDLLLELARRQKVDLHRISVLALAEQYLTFIEQARTVRLELAADYLVMAAWLAYLKSRLLLPRPAVADEPEAAELAAALAERLRRLETMRAAAAALEARPRLGRDMALRGAADQDVNEGGAPVWTATLYDLLSAYAHRRQTRASARFSVAKRTVWSLNDARAALQRLVGTTLDWSALDDFLAAFCPTSALSRTVRASAFAVALEMVREGQLALRQEGAFAPLWVKASGDASQGAMSRSVAAP